MKNILTAGILALVLTAPIAARPQKTESAPSLVELARQTQARRKAQGAKPARVFTNDNVPHQGGINVIGPEAPPSIPSGDLARPPRRARARRAERSQRQVAERDIPCREAAPPGNMWLVPAISRIAIQPQDLAKFSVHLRRTPEERSTSAKDAFKRECPCPATGEGRGACPGYVIDHIKPLACGGADAPGNMAWQTVAEGKAKDKWERRDCGEAD